MNLDPPIPNNLGPIYVNDSLRHNLVSTNRGPELGPQRPVYSTQHQDQDAHNREDVVRISVSPDISIRRRDERHDSQESVAKQEDDRDGQESPPTRVPLLFLLVLQVDESARHEAVDPCTGVGIKVDDEIVGRSRRRCEQNNNRHEPVEKELSGVSISFHLTIR